MIDSEDRRGSRSFENLLIEAKSQLTTKDNGVFIAKNDSVFAVEEVKGSFIRGNIIIEKNTLPLNMSDSDNLYFYKCSLKRGVSLRSRLQQASVKIDLNNLGEPHLDDGKINVSANITNIEGKPFKHVPDSFGLLRFFVENPKLRLVGDSLTNARNDIVPFIETVAQYYHAQIFPNRFIESGNKLSVPFKSEQLLVIESDSIDLTAVISSASREELDEVLGVKSITSALIDNDRFFIAQSVFSVSVPKDKALVIQSPNHLPSLLIDPGFSGNVRFESKGTNYLQDPGYSTYIDMFVYNHKS